MLLTRLKVATHHLDLDARLAAGEQPDGSPELGRRARDLQSRRVRHRLADGLENAVVDLLRLVLALRSEAAFQAAFHAEAG